MRAGHTPMHRALVAMRTAHYATRMGRSAHAQSHRRRRSSIRTSHAWVCVCMVESRHACEEIHDRRGRG